MDIDIKSENGNFKLRVSAVIIKDNKLLTIKCKKIKGYNFPGGHVELGESANTAIIREAKEELNMNVKIENIIAINENIYRNKNGITCQDISYYYRLSPMDNIDTNDFELDENDKGVLKHHEYHWMDLDNLEGLMPKNITELLMDDKDVTNKILFNNEL